MQTKVKLEAKYQCSVIGVASGHCTPSTAGGI